MRIIVFIVAAAWLRLDGRVTCRHLNVDWLTVCAEEEGAEL